MNNGDIISGAELSKELESYVSKAAEIEIISAYVKCRAIDWFNSIGKPKVKLLTRLSPQDILNGSTDIDGLYLALNLGWKVYFNPKLHAKIYLVDNNILFIGSANFTTNGLSLDYKGNDEAMLKTVINERNKEVINYYFNSSLELNSTLLGIMTEYLKDYESCSQEEIPSAWPRTIIPEKYLLVTDFPLEMPNQFCLIYTNNPTLPFAVIETWADSIEKKRNILFNTKSYIWLVNILRISDGKEIYFGKLVSILHDDIDEDPKPYRRELKELVANLLGYVECYAKDIIVVDRPNYSQRIRLLT